MLKGVNITYIKRVKSGTDSFGVATYTESNEVVKNVLVAPVNIQGINVDVNDLSKRRELLQIAIPKGDTHNWEDCRIIYNNKRYRSVGIPQEGIDDLIPLSWNKKVTVERYE